MKQKISITIDEKKLKVVEEMLRGSRFRNKSHIFEQGLDKILEEENGR